MALLKRNEMRDPLKICPICKCGVSNRRYFKHLAKCKDTHESNFDAMNLTICPYNDLHIMHKDYLEDHLEHRCDEVMNNIRQTLQDPSKFKGKLIDNGPVSLLKQLMEPYSIESNLKYIKDKLVAKQNNTEQDEPKKLGFEQKDV